ncbi:MAG: hypothetical protein ACOYB1_11285 [Limnohabitans sp.]
MKSKTIAAALLALTQASWMLAPAHAQPGEHGKPEKAEKYKRHEEGQQERWAHPQSRHHNTHSGQQGSPQGMDSAADRGSVQMGGYFQERQREAARAYYARPENRGFCPPGLAKKGHGCLPPGQARKWRQGYPLPADVVYDEVPRSVVISLGVPPSGYRYVRVASDILLIAVGTRVVVDAIQDLVR